MCSLKHSEMRSFGVCDFNRMFNAAQKRTKFTGRAWAECIVCHAMLDAGCVVMSTNRGVSVDYQTLMEKGYYAY